MILLDTHVALWLTTEKRQLSKSAGTAIRSASAAGDGIAIAGSSLWEVAWASTRGQIRLPSSLAEYLRYLERMFTVLPMTGSIAEQALLFSDGYPKDPTDRIIGATAVVQNLSLVTRDARIRASKEVHCIW